MRRIFFASLVTGFTIGSALGQTLTQLGPFPTGNNHWCSSFVSQTKGFVCGEGLGLYRTEDGGLSWIKISLPGYQSEPLYNVTFINANIGVLSGNSATSQKDIYRTTDGGLSWQPVTSFPLGGSWYHQDYVSQTVGFMGSNGAIVRTTDAGATWQLRSGYPTCPVIYGMDFKDSNVGFVSGNDVPNNLYGVFRTTDGGQSWTRVMNQSSNDVIYLSDSVLLADAGTTIMRSENGGQTWFAAGLNVDTGLNDLERVTNTLVFGVSHAGDIWRSPDGGFTWTKVMKGEGDLPGNWSVEFYDSLVGSVVGVKGLIYRTTDGGLTWTRMNRGIGNDWDGIVAFSEDKLLMVGHHGYVQTTEDGGENFDIQLLDPPYWGRDTGFHSVSSIGSKFAFAVGAWGAMTRTVDGGKTWENLFGTISVDYYANDVWFTDPMNGWMAGWDYTPGWKSYTKRTTDGGLTWNTVEGANVPGMAIQVRGNLVWLQTSSEPHWRSTDGGQTFEMIMLPSNSGSSPAVMDMSFANDNLGYVVGFFGYIAKTLDGGKTWKQVGQMVDRQSILDVLAIGSEVWICGADQWGNGAFIKLSEDGGATWRTWNLPGQWTSPYQMTRVGRHLYVCGYAGGMWKIEGLKRLPSQTGPSLSR
ncbi:MAG: Ycf48-like protein [Fimbriimonadaceae bacterium]|nr:Ycf48-like protein [Fimbriimonadaceae bacterium]